MASEKHSPSPREEDASSKASKRKSGVMLGAFGGLLALICCLFAVLDDTAPAYTETEGNRRSPNTSSLPSPSPSPSPASAPTSAPSPELAPRGYSPAFSNVYNPDRRALYWWDEIPEQVRESSINTGDASNIRPKDYAGAQSCKECHPANHKDWMTHSHRRMNALAAPATVVGDFSGKAEIDYLGGKGSFYREGDRFFMRLQRADVTRVYGIERTIGSRFFQYYVGKLIEGPEPGESEMRTVEHVLPFGYWLDKAEWVPTVHVFRETRKDDDDYDPYLGGDIVSYDQGCASCHTTLAVGDWMMRTVGMERVSKFTPRSLLFDVPGYLNDTKPEFVKGDFSSSAPLADVVAEVNEDFIEMSVRKHAITLGISCEACHNGCQQHVSASDADSTESPPLFFPASPHLFVRGPDNLREMGRNDSNRNFICAKCHSGERPPYADGQDTWNSTEFSAALDGACYSYGSAHAGERGMKTLTCVHCHDPHKGIGKKWPLTPAQDDRKCVDCHQQFERPAAVAAHTHHPVGSAGSRCMNCHMPKINEGMQDMVRSHRITKPTGKSMIEANQPNACNLCHLDKPIDWTIGLLRERYGGEHVYSETELTANYPDRDGPVGRGWLNSPHAPTRLSASWALTKANARWALEDLLDGLNDSHLINRQFLQSGLDEMLGVSLKERGYQFYMDEPRRREVIKTLKQDF